MRSSLPSKGRARVALSWKSYDDASTFEETKSSEPSPLDYLSRGIRKNVSISVIRLLVFFWTWFWTIDENDHFNYELNMMCVKSPRFSDLYSSWKYVLLYSTVKFFRYMVCTVSYDQYIYCYEYHFDSHSVKCPKQCVSRQKVKKGIKKKIDID